MHDPAYLMLMIAVEEGKLRPGLLDLVEQLPTLGGRWSANDPTVATYLGLLDQAKLHLSLWEEDPADTEATTERSCIESLDALLEWFGGMTVQMRGFIEEADAPAEVDGKRPEVDTSVATPERDKAIDKLRAGIESDKKPAKLRDLLELDLEAEQFQTAADEIRSEADELRERISELEAEVAELEAEATNIEERAAAVEEVGDKVITALEAIDYLDEAEGHDEREEARERILDALEDVVEAYDAAS